MATWRVPILGPNCWPDSSGNAYFQNYDGLATNDLFKLGVAVFADSGTKIGFHGSFAVPKNYVGTSKVIIVWTDATATTGNVVWDFDYRAVGGDNTESLDQATFQESLTVTDAAPGAVNRRLETSVTLTAANLAIDDTVTFVISRDGVDAADTLADKALLMDLLFEFVDA